MPDAINPEALPGWPCKDTEAEEVTLLACLLGKHVTRDGDKVVNEQPLTGPFGHAMLFWEVRRHDDKLVELLTKQRTPPDNDDWKGDPAFSTLYAAPTGFITSAPIIPKEGKLVPLEPWFPDIPFLSLEAIWQNVLAKLFTPGQPAFEIAKVEILDEMGVFEKFKNLAALARSRRKPGERRSEPTIAKREKGDPGKPVYDAGITFRPYMGIEAVREGFEHWLKDNSKLFTEVDTSGPAQLRWDPRLKLSNLAILRLVHLHGYPGAMDWTREHRPGKCLNPLIESDYESYFVEREKPKGDRPLYEKGRDYKAAVRRALATLAQISKR
jgi:hypothetical protein